MTGGQELQAFVGRVRIRALLLALIGTGVLVAGWRWYPESFYPTYLVAYLFWLGVTLGALAIVMLHHLTGGGWGLPVRRLFEATLINFVLLAVLFVPLVTALPALYPWARPDAAADHVLQQKMRYLNVESFQIRAVVYFAIWIGLAILLNLFSAGTRPEDEYRRQRRLSAISGPGMVLWGLTVTFACIDWAMSLEPHWFSTMFGVLFMGGQAVAALAFALLVLVLLRTRTGWPSTLTRDRLNDLGNLLLAFVMFWSYVSFMQYLIIWSGNMPEETPWYLKRTSGLWLIAAISLVTLHFFLPFLLLLYRQVKRKPAWLAGVAALLLLMRWVDLLWLVVPAFPTVSVHMIWLSLASMAAMGGWWFAAFIWRLPARAKLPVYELREMEMGHEYVQHASP